MALQDLFKKLQEQNESDIIYSEPEASAIKIIPPLEQPEVIEKVINQDKKIILKLVQETTNLSLEDKLFNASGTHPKLKNIWLSKYKEACKSKKQNSVVNSMRNGSFVITKDGGVLILPKDKEVVRKSTHDILSKTWIL